MGEFVLNKQLEADTHLVCELENCSLRLLDDARWPWLVLVPRIAGIEEWHDLSKGQRIMIDDEVARAASALKTMTGCEKINIAAIGNMVRQLHIHVIARNEGDANWPGPVWGYGEREPYSQKDAASFIEAFKENFS
jgi:diadenosine tetraphosphate (Ap4A) HIT family hydrolase